jgi:signal transduction histidine kinase
MSIPNGPPNFFSELHVPGQNDDIQKGRNKIMANVTLSNRRTSPPDRSAQYMLHESAIQMLEQDRRRISQELHDDLGQRLALLEMQVSRLEDHCVCPDTSRGLRSVRDQIGKMDQEVHRICYQLYPVLLEHLARLSQLL